MDRHMDEAVVRSLFGRVNLGYLLAESQRLADWRRFGRDGLGLHAEPIQSDVLAFRIDRHARRIIVRQGPAEDVVSLGWQLADASSLDLALSRLQARGIGTREIGGGEAALRGVERFWAFDGPKRLRFELFTQPLWSQAALDMRASGFVTGALGMGHIAMTTREPEAMLAALQDFFDARISDYIEDRLNGIGLDMTFLRLNPRHHSIAIAATQGKRMDPIRTRIHHLNLQAATFEDVVQAYRRMRELGFPIASGMGQHPNDRELSFYATSPSGFEIEIGWNPIEVSDEASWQQERYRGISLWGHHPEGLTLAAKLRQMGRGVLSLARTEFVMASADDGVREAA